MFKFYNWNRHVFLEAAGDEGGDKGGQGEAPAAPEIDYDKLAAAMAKAQGKPPAGDEGGDKDKGDKDEKELSGMDKLNAEEQAKEDQRKLEADIRQNIQFESSFDGFIKENKGLFKLTADRMRDGARGLTGSDLQHSLSCTAAKDFFSNEKNLNLLPEADQRTVKDAILGNHDNNIDSGQAWQLVQNAIHITNRLRQHGSFKESGQNSYDSDSSPEVAKYIDSCKKRGAGQKLETA